MFKLQIGKTVEVYIDDMIVKIKVTYRQLADLADVFNVWWRYKLCLNASKCVYGVGSSKFLKYLITCQGIKVNPEQIIPIQNLQPRRNPKEV